MVWSDSPSMRSIALRLIFTSFDKAVSSSSKDALARSNILILAVISLRCAVMTSRATLSFAFSSCIPKWLNLVCNHLSCSLTALPIIVFICPDKPFDHISAGMRAS